MKIINEREQMKNWIAISESSGMLSEDQYLAENPLMAVGRMIISSGKFMLRFGKFILDLLGIVIAFIGVCLKLIGGGVQVGAQMLRFLSRALAVVFAALAGVAIFSQAMGELMMKFNPKQDKKEGIDLSEEQSEYDLMLQNIDNTIKSIRGKMSAEEKAQFKDWNENTWPTIQDDVTKAVAKQLPQDEPAKQEPNVSPSGQPLEPGTLKPMPGDLK
jgi:hypothetical protein